MSIGEVVEGIVSRWKDFEAYSGRESGPYNLANVAACWMHQLPSTEKPSSTILNCGEIIDSSALITPSRSNCCCLSLSLNRGMLG